MQSVFEDIRTRSLQSVCATNQACLEVAPKHMHLSFHSQARTIYYVIWKFCLSICKQGNITELEVLYCSGLVCCAPGRRRVRPLIKNSRCQILQTPAATPTSHAPARSAITHNSAKPISSCSDERADCNKNAKKFHEQSRAQNETISPKPSQDGQASIRLPRLLFKSIVVSSQNNLIKPATYSFRNYTTMVNADDGEGACSMHTHLFACSRQIRQMLAYMRATRIRKADKEVWKTSDYLIGCE